jgi:hypothetical protein
MDVITLFTACFDGDTLVATEDGFKRIDEIQAGDRVWSYNVETGEKSLKEVSQVFVKESNEMLHLETTEGRIDATTNHPFYVTGKGWVAAGDLVVGDEVHTLDGDTGTVTGFKFEKLDKSIVVYNLEVADFQSYFVGSEGILVHNKAGCNNNRVLEETKIGPYSVSVDLEMGGSGPNIHIKINGSGPNYYDPTTKTFQIPLPKGLKKSTEILNAVEKALKLIAQGWGQN